MAARGSYSLVSSAASVPVPALKLERCVVFIDGSNFYFQLRNAGIIPGDLDYARLAMHLVKGRAWVETRLYVGRVDPTGGKLFKDQQSFLKRFQQADSRHTVVLGKIQRRFETNPLAVELLTYLADLPVRINSTVYRELVRRISVRRRVPVFKEKGVDVALACDAVRYGMENRYELAYLISNDGDLRPAVDIVRSYRKRVFAAGCVIGPQLKQACDRAIVLDREVLEACCR